MTHKPQETQQPQKGWKKWVCDECHTTYKTKRELVECLKDHLDEAEATCSCCEYQLQDLGIENPWE